MGARSPRAHAAGTVCVYQRAPFDLVANPVKQMAPCTSVNRADEHVKNSVGSSRCSSGSSTPDVAIMEQTPCRASKGISGQPATVDLLVGCVWLATPGLTSAIDSSGLRQSVNLYFVSHAQMRFWNRSSFENTSSVPSVNAPWQCCPFWIKATGPSA